MQLDNPSDYSAQRKVNVSPEIIEFPVYHFKENGANIPVGTKIIYWSSKNKGKNISKGSDPVLHKNGTKLTILWEGLQYFHMSDFKMYLKTEYKII